MRTDGNLTVVNLKHCNRPVDGVHPQHSFDPDPPAFPLRALLPQPRFCSIKVMSFAGTSSTALSISPDMSIRALRHRHDTDVEADYGDLPHVPCFSRRPCFPKLRSVAISRLFRGIWHRRRPAVLTSPSPSHLPFSPGVGSHFVYRNFFSLRFIQALHALARDLAKEISPLPSTREKILIAVTDLVFTSGPSNIYLRQSDYDVASAESSAEAFQLLRAGGFDLLLLSADPSDPIFSSTLSETNPRLLAQRRASSCSPAPARRIARAHSTWALMTSSLRLGIRPNSSLASRAQLRTEARTTRVLRKNPPVRGKLSSGANRLPSPRRYRKNDARRLQSGARAENWRRSSFRSRTGRRRNFPSLFASRRQGIPPRLFR